MTERKYLSPPALMKRQTEDVRVDRWVAHPALVKIAMDIFDDHMKGPHQVGLSRFAPPCKVVSSIHSPVLQYHIRKEEVSVSELELIDPKVPGKITDKGVRENISA
jgi:malate synthase